MKITIDKLKGGHITEFKVSETVSEKLIIGAATRRARFLAQKQADKATLRLLLALVAGLVLLTFAFSAGAGDFKAGIFLASNHDSDQYTCDAVGDLDYNETNPGFWVSYKGFFVGRYENSVSNCPEFDYSNVFGYEREFYRYGEMRLSYSLGVADGYFDEEITGEYRAWATINLRFSIYKLWYAGKVAAHSLEFDF